jgi:hypothetical protein
MRRFNYALAIVTLLILAAIPTVAQSIVVSNDEQFTSQNYLSADNDQLLVTNIAAWLTSGVPGKRILILSSNPGLNNAALISYLGPGTGNLGYAVTTTVTAPATLVNGTGAPLYDAVFVSGDCRYDSLAFATTSCSAGFAALDAVLVNYVNAGGNVFLEVGLVCDTGGVTWDPFLNAFGMAIAPGCNGISQQNVNVSSFQGQTPYGPALFAGVNSVYIDEGEDVQPFGTVCGAQIFTTGGNGLYGAWRPCACGQTGPHHLGNRSVGPSVMPAGAQGRKVHSSPPAPPPPANEVYDNGPINGDVNAWTINFGYSVSDSLEILRTSQVSGISFGAWLYPGDTITTVEVQIGGGAFGGNLLDEIVPVTQSDCVDNACGYAVCTENAAFDPRWLWTSCWFGSCPATYWVTLQNAVVSTPGDPAFWDENFGAGCGGFLGINFQTCPSSAFSSSTIGPIPSEAFTLQ